MLYITTIPRDYARCNDNECPLKNQCLRWLDRYNGYSFVNFQIENGKCNSQIKPKH